MPSVSKKQHNLMALVANDPAASKRLGIKQSVGKDFLAADKGKKFAQGGIMKEGKSMMKKEINFFKKKGAPKSMIKHEEKELATAKFAKGGGIESRGKTSCKTVRMAKGGGVEIRGKTRGKFV